MFAELTLRDGSTTSVNADKVMSVTASPEAGNCVVVLETGTQIAVVGTAEDTLALLAGTPAPKASARS